MRLTFVCLLCEGVEILTYVVTELFFSQASFVFDSTVSDVVLPFSKSESTQMS